MKPGTSAGVPAQTGGGPPRHQTPHCAPQSPALHPPAYGQVSSTAFAPERQTGTTHPCGCLSPRQHTENPSKKGRRGGGWEGGSSRVVKRNRRGNDKHLDLQLDEKSSLKRQTAAVGEGVKSLSSRKEQPSVSVGLLSLHLQKKEFGEN